MNIALVAMSGIRVQDAELLQLGLTLPGFVERSKTIASLPSLGLLTIAAATDPAYDVSYFEVDELDDGIAILSEFDLVGISSFSARMPDAYLLADRLRSVGVPVVIGGLHATVRPEEALEHCDAVIAGEGEPLWPMLLSDFESGQMAQLYDARSVNFDLADSPIPRYDLLDISRYNRLTVQTSRGCPHRCEFCASSILLTDRYKQKPVQRVVDEVDAILDIWPRPFIEFADDNAFVNRKYWKQLLPELSDRNLRWFAETDLTVANDEELLDMMRSAGCAQVLIGFESPTANALHGIETRNDWKYRKFDTYIEAIETIQKLGITVNGCFVIGLDGHTTDVFDDVYRFVSDSGLYDVQITIQTAFPGTPLYDRLQSEGRLLEPDNWSRCTLFDLNYEPRPMSADDLVAGFRELAVRLYEKEFTEERRRRFRRNEMVSHPERGLA